MARGDEEFVEFVTTCSERLLRAAYLLTGDAHRAEEAAQSALVRTYAKWSRVRREDAYAYTRRIMVNQLIDEWRRPWREYAAPQLPDHLGDPSGDPADEVVARRWVLAALATLTPRERAIVVLRYYFELSEVDTAAELDVSVGTIKSTASRALAKLRITVGEAAGAGARTAPDRPVLAWRTR